METLSYPFATTSETYGYSKGAAAAGVYNMFTAFKAPSFLDSVACSVGLSPFQVRAVIDGQSNGDTNAGFHAPPWPKETTSTKRAYLLHERGGQAHRIHVRSLVIVKYGAPATEARCRVKIINGVLRR